MAQNYTPLNLKEFKGKSSKSSGANTLLIVIAIVTACVLAVILIVLIQRKMNSSASTPTDQQNLIPSPPEVTLEPESSNSGSIQPDSGVAISPATQSGTTGSSSSTLKSK